MSRRIFRRRMLQATAAAGVGLPLGCTLGTGSVWAAQARFPPFTVPSPVFSLAERNRRWAAVRANMARPQWNLDAIITAASDRGCNNARYLTQVVIAKGSQGGRRCSSPAAPTRRWWLTSAETGTPRNGFAACSPVAGCPTRNWY